ncbi:MAG: nucleotidyltransferase family protein [Bacteroidales bacterium]|nr:nucleotidyltransferase family protein [Bacteroidales bacterium]
MKAMILAAGLGTRLQPITQDTPKALVKISDLTLLEILITRLKRFGIKEVIINIHHFADQIVDFIKEQKQFGINISFSDERDQLLDTGGGIKKAEWFLKDGNPFLVHNVDVISTIDLNDFADFHKKCGCLATLAVRNRNTSRYFLFNGKDVLCGWKNISTDKQIITNQSPIIYPYAFSGVHILNPEIFELMERTGRFSIVDEYLRLSNDYKICAYKHDNTEWLDLGNVENLKQAANIIDQII